MAELGDLTRFDSPRQLMAYLGLVPSEHSSGQRRRQGGITKTGNTHVRRVLVESAWSYQYPARKTKHLQRRAKQTSSAVQAIAWKAQKRLCGRYQHLVSKGKLKVQTCVAVARELTGFIWAIAQQVCREEDLFSPPVELGELADGRANDLSKDTNINAAKGGSKSGTKGDSKSRTKSGSKSTTNNPATGGRGRNPLVGQVTGSRFAEPSTDL